MNKTTRETWFFNSFSKTGEKLSCNKVRDINKGSEYQLVSITPHGLKWIKLTLISKNLSCSDCQVATSPISRSSNRGIFFFSALNSANCFASLLPRLFLYRFGSFSRSRNSQYCSNIFSHFSKPAKIFIFLKKTFNFCTLWLIKISKRDVWNTDFDSLRQIWNSEKKRILCKNRRNLPDRNNR